MQTRGIMLPIFQIVLSMRKGDEPDAAHTYFRFYEGYDDVHAHVHAHVLSCLCELVLYHIRVNLCCCFDFTGQETNEFPDLIFMLWGVLKND